ncbi:hypothetical protein AYP92_08090 [Lactobacillus crispatus]|uniref:hypothetical protein n=1 Tax=Lactobacillus TaxID=1578 RepID=UPI000B5DA987|nr:MULTISPECIES: hypothetical protein [Lactobacillus]OXC42711.1 hypothetical protein AYP92_08090 [Lactobacillus crispatus]PEH12454.1 hypothetical protein CP352_03170 [Lactobacillus sp. UMNPBX1]
MSLIRDPATITKVGRQMMTAGGDITYTKATLYGQDISHLTKDQLESLTSIGSPLMTVPVGISDKSVNGSATTIVLEVTFQNSNLKADLPYTAVGFFAKKGDDEKLVLVGVADPGAYLVATPPDGIATDALDIKVAISIGDAASVTAVVDPAGSVTPATLNGAINKATHDLTAQIDTKADKTTVEQELAIKANFTDVDKKLDTKANSSDVYTKKQVDDAFANRDATIATKADKAVVDAEIAKIDFTPYAKTVDVDTKIKDVSDVVATKVGTDYSYSKAELDKKLLAISTDTDGKVDASQVADMITNKADKADVDKSIKAVNDTLATKADQATTYSKTDVDKLLSAKDDVTDVDAKIKTVTDLANTKASQDGLNKLSQAVDTKADKATVDAQIAGIDFSKIKFRKQYLDSQGQTQDHTWKATKNTDGTYTIDLYNDDWTASKVHDLLAQLPTKADQSNVNSLVQDAKNTATSRADNLQNQINSKLNYYYVGDGYDVLSSDGKWGILESNNAQNLKNLPAMGNTTWAHMLKLERDGWGVVIVYSQDNTIWQNVKNGDTWTGWSRLANALDVNNLQKNIDGANANANGRLPYSGGNMSLRSTINWNGGGINDRTGNLGGLHWEGGTDRVDLFADQDGNDNLDLVIQLGDDNSNSVVIRNASGAQVARIDAGGNITSPTITTLQNQVNDLINQINYIKDNYIEGRRFPASQEAQAQAWENEKPTRIAMIEK